MRSQIFTAAVAALLVACGGSEGQAQTTAAGAPVATKTANSPEQTPAFTGQARAPEMKSELALDVQTYARGLEKPWGMAFLPDGALLVTEKPGRLRIVGKDGALSTPVQGLPEVDARGQGGLLAIALDPDFGRSNLIYWSYAELKPDGTNHTAVARGRLVRSGGGARVDGVQVIFRQTPSLASTMHYGSRLVFGRDKTLFILLGERSIIEGRVQAQRMDGTLGKVVRINADGSIPKDNPFVGRQGARPEIWSIGHRNIQSAALDASGKLWEVEHGARGGDELNLVQKGKDYGWPTITYGEEYSGQPVGQGLTAKSGMEQPVYYWDPVIAPSGMAFYQGALFPAWRGNLFVGGLSSKALVRLVMQNDRVVGEERLLTDLNERFRDVIVGPDGALYVATDAADGRILRVTPKS